jgi:hypothetical protein
MSENEWFFEYNYGELMEEWISNGITEIKVDEDTFRRLLTKFLLDISAKEKKGE